MKTSKIIFWTATILFAGFMIFTAIPNITMDPQGVGFITSLGFPEYFIPFIGWAKLMGCIMLLIPKFPTLREWAYAGLTFDLVSALYAVVHMYGFDPGQLMFVAIFAVGIVSYFYHRKLFYA